MFETFPPLVDIPQWTNIILVCFSTGATISLLHYFIFYTFGEILQNLVDNWGAWGARTIEQNEPGGGVDKQQIQDDYLSNNTTEDDILFFLSTSTPSNPP